MSTDQYTAAGFYFSVSIAGQEDAAIFREVTGLTVAVDDEVIAPTEFYTQLPKQHKYDNISLKIGLARQDSTLLLWANDTLSSNLSENVQSLDVEISLRNEKGEQMAQWLLNAAYPVKLAMGELTSAEGDVLVEELELAYYYFAKEN